MTYLDNLLLVWYIESMKSTTQTQPGKSRIIKQRKDFIEKFNTLRKTIEESYPTVFKAVCLGCGVTLDTDYDGLDKATYCDLCSTQPGYKRTTVFTQTTTVA